MFVSSHVALSLLHMRQQCCPTERNRKAICRWHLYHSFNERGLASVSWFVILQNNCQSPNQNNCWNKIRSVRCFAWNCPLWAASCMKETRCNASLSHTEKNHLTSRPKLGLPHALWGAKKGNTGQSVGDRLSRRGRTEMQKQLFAQHVEDIVAGIRRAPKKHPLRKELLKVELLPYQLDGIAFAVG